jgi:levanase
MRVDAGATAELDVPASDAYRLTVNASDADGAGEVRVRVSTAGGFATVGYDFDAQVAFVARDADAIAADMPEAYREVRTAAVAARDGEVTLDIIVDVASIEVFAGRGEAALTMATYGTPGERGLSVEAPRGAVEISDASITPLRVAAVQRRGAVD